MKKISILALTSVLLVACGGDGENVDRQRCEASPTYAEVDAFSSVCTNCHSSELTGDDRNDAPDNVNFDTFAGAQAAAANASDQIQLARMPPPDSGFSLTNEQRAALLTWAACDTPE